MDVLIVKLAALGDVLRTTSLLRPLSRRYPGSRIWWVTAEAAKPLLRGNPWIHRLLGPEQAARADWKGRFDLVLSLEEDEIARLAERACGGELVGVRWRRAFGAPGESGSAALSYTASSASYYRMSLLNRDPGGGLRTANAFKAANRLTYAELWLKILRCPLPRDRGSMRPVLVLSERDRAAARDFAARHGLAAPGRPIGFNPGAGARWPSKQLSVEKARRIAAALGALGRPVILLGGKDEAERNAAILSGLSNVHDGETRHGLRAFAGLMDLCGIVVTTDSLAFHIATALGKKTVALIGPTSAAELDVFGRGAKLLAPGGCSCFYRPRCRLETSCLDRLPERMIVAAVKKLLGS